MHGEAKSPSPCDAPRRRPQAASHKSVMCTPSPEPRAPQVVANDSAFVSSLGSGPNFLSAQTKCADRYRKNDTNFTCARVFRRCVAKVTDAGGRRRGKLPHIGVSSSVRAAGTLRWGVESSGGGGGCATCLCRWPGVGGVPPRVPTHNASGKLPAGCSRVSLGDRRSPPAIFRGASHHRAPDSTSITSGTGARDQWPREEMY